MTTEIPVYEAKIMGTDNTGIFAMSFVDFPANECNFVALARSAAMPVKMKLDKQKRILTGVVLVPDQMIYRNDTQLGEYYLKFGAADIEKIRDKMMLSGVALRTTTHQHEKPLRDNHLIECWIVQNPKMDLSVHLGLGELPKGTLVASYKIGNAAYWASQVLPGKVKGFSIEGLFNFKTVKMATKQKKVAVVTSGKATRLEMAAALFKVLFDGDTAAEAKDLADIAKVDETDSGTPVIIFTLQDGTEIDVDSEGYCQIDGTQAPAGDHLLDDGNTISIGDDGYIIETTDDPAAAEPDAAEAALRAAAKAKGKKAVTMFAKKADNTPRGKELAKLRAKIALLEKTPSAALAIPNMDGGAAQAGSSPAVMKGWQRAAAALRARSERNA